MWGSCVLWALVSDVDDVDACSQSVCCSHCGIRGGIGSWVLGDEGWINEVGLKDELLIVEILVEDKVVQPM